MQKPNRYAYTASVPVNCNLLSLGASGWALALSTRPKNQDEQMKKFNAFIYCTFPEDIESQFPIFGRIEKGDFTRPHASVLYLPDISESEVAKAAAATDLIAKKLRPISASIGKLDSFGEKEGVVPWYVHIESSGLLVLRDIIKDVLTNLDVPVNDKFDNFVAHATLKYLPEGTSYDGTVPKGECLIDELHFAFKEADL